MTNQHLLVQNNHHLPLEWGSQSGRGQLEGSMVEVHRPQDG